LAALLLVLQARYPAAGTVFVGALAAYTVCRQILFPYRAEPRKSSLGRLASMIAAGLVLIADIIVAIVACRRRGPRPAPGRLAQRSKPGPGTR